MDGICKYIKQIAMQFAFLAGNELHVNKRERNAPKLMCGKI